ncbi:MAG: chemotaxis protein CheW [Rickettsiales bacterium]|nr:chemotaxis protein CheW [Rickettsiales bacterium]
MDDLISEFITETSESLSVLDLELVKLEQNPNDEEILGNIFRLVHTIKGTCGFLGLPRLESVAHAGENVLGKIRDHEIEVSPEAISIVLEALDCITGLVEHLAENGEEPEGGDQALIDRLNAMAAGEAPAAADAAEPEPEVEEELEGGLSQDELDALEKAFMEAEATIEGGMEQPVAPQAPEEEVVAEAEPEEAPAEEAQVPEVTQPAEKAETESVSESAKKKAVKQGLAAGDMKEAAAGAGGGNMANQSIRVSLDVLENLMQMVSELVLTRNQLLQIVRNQHDSELKTPLQNLSHITTELQEGVMKTRMQPIGNAWAKFPRLIRDLSIELGKKIELHMEGAETELDRQLLELIKDPLTHMVRNSCDHGLETPDDRIAAGKPELGTVTLRAFHEGGHIIIEIADNGRGVNIERVKQKIIENGLATGADLEEMHDQQIMQYIFKAGFSTAEKVTSVSGRGVGMDVVRTNIEKIGGTVELSSEAGKGSVFHIKIPLTLAIVSVLIVESSEQRFAIPQINVLELVRSARDSEHKIETISNAPVLRLRGKLLPLVSLHDILDLPEQEQPLDEDGNVISLNTNDEQFVVVCSVGGTEYGVIVDRIFDTEEIVVKPVSRLMQDIGVYSGNTILGDGSVIMILDPNGIGKIVGESDTHAVQDEDDKKTSADGERKVSFLTFRSGSGAPKAVPLELVSRLEEINVNDIELSGDTPVIQYRGDLMRLSTLTCSEIPADGNCEVIVFSYDSKTIGLVVDEILDIVRAPLLVKHASEDEMYLGSMVIGEKTTDVVDVGYLLKDMIGDVPIPELMGGKTADGLRLYFVEDSMFFRKLTVPYLETVGFTVEAFESATDALDAMRTDTKPIDAIITDIEMPDIDGYGYAERVRENSANDHIPIIAFTSTVNQQFIARGQEVGINQFIIKTDREALVEAIREQLSIEEVA